MADLSISSLFREIQKKATDKAVARFTKFSYFATAMMNSTSQPETSVRDHRVIVRALADAFRIRSFARVLGATMASLVYFVLAFSAPKETNTPDSSAYFRTSAVIFIEQKVGPHIEQK